MIIVRINGGLGNQLFQYAAGRNLSERLGVELKLDVSGFDNHELRDYGLNNFNIKEVTATKEEVKSLIVNNVRHPILAKLFPKSSKYGMSYIKEKPLFKYNKSYSRLTDNMMLEGYWQNEKYFKDIESIIRSDFSLKTPMVGKSSELEEDIKNSHSVAIHIRRGDYASDQKVKSQFGLCSLDYYKNAVQYIEKEVGGDLSFFIFSDDPQWAKDNLNLNHRATVVDHNGADKCFEDMTLMSLCKHQVIANSTFSWWGAWLNSNSEKVVIAPKNWFTTDKYDTSDLIPKDWKKV